MKHSTYILTLIIGVLSCNNPTVENNIEKSSKDTTQTVPTDRENSNIYIKDKTQYDPAFIDELKKYNDPIKLIDNFIISGNDTTFFPDDIKINKEIVFKADKDNKIFLLKVTRTSLTNINYKYQLFDKEKNVIDSKEGKAILGSMFFLASEVDEDSQTGDSYGSSEYFDNTNNCWFSIRIGIGFDDNGKQRATINHGCEDKKKTSLTLEECPTLRTQ